MDLSVESITLPPWDPLRADEWNEAYEKVENYLRACRVGSRLQRARLTARILQRAYDRQQAREPDALRPLPALAIGEAREQIAAWIARYLPPHGGAREPNPGEGLLALYLCDGAARWPYAFLDAERTPPEFAEALRVRIVRAGPDLAVSSMVPREMDFGLLPELAGSAMETFESLPILRTVLSWLLFIGLLFFLFWHTR